MSVSHINELQIVLVEPSSTQQKLIYKSLMTAGVNAISCVSNGKEALDLLSENKANLVISAMYLEDMVAVTLINKIRQLPLHFQTPMMLISSEWRFRMIDPIKQAGVIAILPKPFTFDALKKALNSTLLFLNPHSLQNSNKNFQKLTALVVDDSLTARHFICRTIQALGVGKIHQADDGLDAIKQLKQTPSIDFIITDYNMPEMDGKALAEYIRGSAQLSEIPIIVVTSARSESLLKSIEQIGVSAICDKPFDPTHIKQLLNHILN